MNDCREIENLIYTYAERIDAGDLQGVAELFRHGCIASPAHGTRTEGYDAVLQMYTHMCRLHEPGGTPLTRHVTTNVIIELGEAPDTAHARACYTVFQATPRLPLQAIISGRYRDTFVKVDAAWRFDQREMYVDLVGDCSEHLPFPAESLLNP